MRTLAKKMKKCAYCESEGSMTREHVIPSFIYAVQNKLKQSCIGWNEVIEKMVGGEFKVKDVCAHCNNVILSELDGYAKKLFTESGILVENYTKNKITLKYNYDLLLRWLLKVSYNSSRTDGAHAHLFKEHIPYMLGASPTPVRAKISLIAYMAAPEYVEKSAINKEALYKLAKGSKVFNPFLVRICYGEIDNQAEYTLRLNIFGPLVFNILIFSENIMPGHASAGIRKFIKTIPYSVELTPKQKMVNLNAIDMSWLDLYEPQIMRAKGLLNVANK